MATSNAYVGQILRREGCSGDSPWRSSRQFGIWPYGKLLKGRQPKVNMAQKMEECVRRRSALSFLPQPDGRPVGPFGVCGLTTLCDCDLACGVSQIQKKSFEDVPRCYPHC